MILTSKTFARLGLLAALIAPVGAMADGMTDLQPAPVDHRFHPVYQSVAPSCPSPLPYQITGSRELSEISTKLSKSITEVQGSMEEWGTLMMSGLLLAPPVSGGTGTFAVDINGTPRKIDATTFGQYDFAHWFAESGQAEGSAQFSERIFNSLVASGTLQLAPEQAAIAESFLRKQRVNQQLFAEQLDRDRAARGAQLEDFKVARAGATQARQVRIDAARAAADRARTAQAEAALVLTETQRQKTAAEREMNKAAAASLKDPGNATLRQEFLTRQTDFDSADAASTQAGNNLRARGTEQDTAQQTLADEMGQPIATGTLPNAGVTTPTTSPTFGKDSFEFASEATPGESITQARGFTNAVPAIAADSKGLVTNINGLGENQLPSLLGLKNDTAPETAFPARARLIDAAGNQTIARIFDFLGNPSAALQFKDKPIAMAAGTIAVNPGWRTFQDYDGSIDVSASYQWKPARRTTCDRLARFGRLQPADQIIFNPEEIKVAGYFADHGRWPKAESFTYTGDLRCLKEKPGKPLAAAVSPLMERQNLDEASSRASQDEIALFLSASLARSGQKAAGEIFNKFVRTRRLDVKTRSSLPVVNSYGLGGARFGFNVTSRLRAIGDIDKGQAGKVLEKQNFPVLVVFGLSGEDLRPRLVRHTEDGVDSAEIWEPQLVLTQTHRWNRARKRGDLHEVLHSMAFPGFPGRPMDAPSEAYEILKDVSYWRTRLNTYLVEKKQVRMSESLFQYQKLVEEEWHYLNQANFGARTELDIPAEYLVGPAPEGTAPPTPGRPSIQGIFPPALVPRQVAAAANSPLEAEAVIVGDNLDQVDLKSLAATPENITVTKLPLPPGISEKQAISVKFTFAPPTPTAFQLRLPIGAAAPNGFQKYLYSPLIQVPGVRAFALNAANSDVRLAKTGVQTLELLVNAVGVSTADLLHAEVEVTHPVGEEWRPPVLGRVHQSAKNPETFLVEVIADVPKDFTEGALRLRLKPPAALASNGASGVSDLRSSEFHLRME